jgi:hypothetical protein
MPGEEAVIRVILVEKGTTRQRAPSPAEVTAPPPARFRLPGEDGRGNDRNTRKGRAKPLRPPPT